MAGKLKKITGVDVTDTSQYIGASPQTNLERSKDLESLLNFKSTQKARAKIKPMPDIELGKALLRKQAARKRKSRGGRASTILSEGTDTLG